MKIETKFNVKNAVYCIYDNIVQESYVVGIYVSVEGNRPVTNITYRIRLNSGEYIDIEENKIFLTKEALIASL